MPDVIGWRFSGLPLDFTTFLGARRGSPAVPRAAAVLGPSYGDSALHAATAHYVVMTRGSSVALSGPSVVEPAIGEQRHRRRARRPGGRGGPAATPTSSSTPRPTRSTPSRAFLSYLPSNAALPAPAAPPRRAGPRPRELAALVPAGPAPRLRHARGPRRHRRRGLAVPWADAWAPSLLCALARIEGRPVGIVASQPIVRAGALDVPALAKEHDFVDLCDTFGLPLVFLHDVPGLMIGRQAERGGILHGYERLVSRIARATVPKVGGRAAQGLRRRPLRDGRAADEAGLPATPGPRRDGLHGARHRHPHRPPAQLDRLLADEGPDARDARRRRARPPNGSPSPSRGRPRRTSILDDVIDRPPPATSSRTASTSRWGAQVWAAGSGRRA